MRHERGGAPGEGRRHTFRRLVLAWVFGALLACPLASATPAVATPAVAAPRAAANPIQVAKVVAGAAQAGGRLTQRSGQAGTAEGRVALVIAVERLWPPQGSPGPHPVSPVGVPVADPSPGGFVPVDVATPLSARGTPAAARGAVRGRAPPGGVRSAIAGPSSPLTGVTPAPGA